MLWPVVSHSAKHARVGRHKVRKRFLFYLPAHG